MIHFKINCPICANTFDFDERSLHHVINATSFDGTHELLLSFVSIQCPFCKVTSEIETKNTWYAEDSNGKN